jgi:hypothetical protein
MYLESLRASGPGPVVRVSTTESHLVLRGLARRGLHEPHIWFQRPRDMVLRGDLRAGRGRAGALVSTTEFSHELRAETFRPQGTPCSFNDREPPHGLRADAPTSSRCRRTCFNDREPPHGLRAALRVHVPSGPSHVSTTESPLMDFETPDGLAGPTWPSFQRPRAPSWTSRPCLAEELPDLAEVSTTESPLMDFEQPREPAFQTPAYAGFNDREPPHGLRVLEVANLSVSC